MVLLRVPLEKLRDALGGAEPARARGIDGGVILTTELSVRDLEPGQLGAALRSAVGESLDLHDDERGLFVFPDVVRPKSRSYEGVIEEIAEAGEWMTATPAVVGEAASGEPQSLDQLVGGVMQAFGPELFEMARGVMENNPDLARDLMGGDPGSMDLGSLTRKAQELMQQNPELAETLARQMGGKDPSDDD